MKLENNVLVKVKDTDIVDGVFYVPVETEKIGEKAFVGCGSLKKVVCNNKLIEINDYAFMDLQNLKEVVLNETLESLGKGLFFDCANLEKINLPEKLKSIGESCFYSCKSLKEVFLPNELTKISEGCFENCEGMLNVKIPDKAEIIEKKAFKSCKSLSQVTLNETCKKLQDQVFSDCISLEKIELPDNITEMGHSIFRDCFKLTDVTISKNIKKIPDCTFQNCKVLKSLMLHDEIAELGNNSFNGCNALVDIEINDSVKKMGNGVFQNCENLERVKLPDNVELGAWVFNGCTNLTEVNLPDNMTELPDSFFRNCVNLVSISLPNGIKTIENQAFVGCKKIKEVILPKALKSVKQYAFSNCFELEKIVLPDNVEFIGEAAFSGSKKIKEITVPEKVTEILERTFFCCEGLEKVNLKGNITKLEERAFANTTLHEITLTSDLNLVNENAFNGCGNLKKVTINYPDGVMEIPCNNLIYWKSLIFNFENGLCAFNNGLVYFRMDGKNYVIDADKEMEKAKILYPDKGFDELEKDIKILPAYKSWQNTGKFMPSGAIVATLPLSYQDNFYINNNCGRWGEILKTSGYNDNKSKTALIKLCFALGLFEKEEAISVAASKFINEKILPLKLSEDRISNKFLRFDLSTGFKTDFVDFFTKYYENNTSFMVKKNEDDDGSKDVMTECFNNFNFVKKVYPDKLFNTNRKVDLLTHEDIMSVVNIKQYKKINSGNEPMAHTVAQYGYSQSQFEALQEIYDKAQEIKPEELKLVVTKDDDTMPVYYDFLEKKNPLGLVLGDLTNCCQKLGNNGESCMQYGVEKPNSGFVVFYLGKNILAQGWVWYDEKTKIVTIDNIEMPKVKRDKFFKDKELQTNLFEAIERYAENVKEKMKTINCEVEKVTMGLGGNLDDKLPTLLKDRYETVDKIKMLTGYTGHSDANKIGQVEIKLKNKMEKEDNVRTI